MFLDNVSWQTYEKLLDDLVDSSAPRLTHDRGVLEITSQSRRLQLRATGASGHAAQTPNAGAAQPAIGRLLKVVVLNPEPSSRQPAA